MQASRSYTSFYIQLVCAALLAMVFGFKTAGSTSPGEVYIYFTSWMWTVLLIWCWWLLAALLCPSLWRGVACGLFFFAFGATWNVFIVFTAVVLSNGEALTRFQGDMTFGELYAGEKVTHGVPVLAMLGFAIMNYRSLRTATRGLYKHWWDGRPFPASRTAFCALAAWWLLGSLAVMGIYGSYTDPWATYRSRLSWGESFAVGLGSSLVAVGICMWAVVFREPPPPQLGV